jgi:hypothetical protein
MPFPVDIRDTAPSSTSRELGTIDNEVRIADGELDPQPESELEEILRGKLPPSLAYIALGLTASELQTLRREQLLAAQRDYAESSFGSRRTSLFGSRASQASSRAGSAVSSQGGRGRVFLDPKSLQQLNARFEHLMRRLQDRNDAVSTRVYF